MIERAAFGLAGAALGVLLLSGGASPAADAVRAWLDGRAGEALRTLESLPPSREREFNRALVQLYQGEAAAAEAGLVRLLARDAGWAPAQRWLARAQKDLGRPAAADTAAVLLRSSSATTSDQIWAARLFEERRDLVGARDAFRRAAALDADLYDAWTGLAGIEAALGNVEGSRTARGRAEALYPGGPTPVQRTVPLPVTPLRYRARFLFVPLAEVTVSESTPADVQGGRLARSLVLGVRASGPFLRMDSVYETDLDVEGGLLRRRQVSSDPTSSRRQAVLEFEPESGAFRTRQVRDGLFHYDVLPSPAPARPYDGPALLEAARAVARSGVPFSVLRLADAGWKGTRIRRGQAERIRWQGREVDTVRVEIGIGSRGAAGLQGGLQLWISTDERALPYRAKMAIAVGSVTVELQPDQAPAPASP